MDNRIEQRRARSILVDALLLIPNFLKLLYRLFKDARVPTAEKALLIGAIAYVISPLDLIPDVIPLVGEIDDLYFVALVVLRLLGNTQGEVINQHWDGPGDLAGVVNKIVRAAQYVLPKRVQRILLGRVEFGPRVKGELPAAPVLREPEKERRV